MSYHEVYNTVAGDSTISFRFFDLSALLYVFITVAEIVLNMGYFDGMAHRSSSGLSWLKSLVHPSIANLCSNCYGSRFVSAVSAVSVGTWDG